MLCLSVGVQTGAAAGTSPVLSAGWAKDQRAGRPGERQEPAGHEQAEHTTLWVGQVRTPVHTGTLTLECEEQRKLELRHNCCFKTQNCATSAVIDSFKILHLCQIFWDVCSHFPSSLVFPICGNMCVVFHHSLLQLFNTVCMGLLLVTIFWQNILESFLFFLTCSKGIQMPQ